MEVIFCCVDYYSHVVIFILGQEDGPRYVSWFSVLECVFLGIFQKHQGFPVSPAIHLFKLEIAAVALYCARELEEVYFLK